MRSARKCVLILLLLACFLPIAGCLDGSPAAGAESAECHPSYEGACLDPDAEDYDCESGEGNGPRYTGYVTVVGPDEFDLDRDGDGEGCEL
jgi:hypothetical protein